MNAVKHDNIIAEAMKNLDRFGSVQKGNPRNRPAMIATATEAMERILQQGKPGGWSSDHREESARYTGWNYVAVNAIAKAAQMCEVGAFVWDEVVHGNRIEARQKALNTKAKGTPVDQHSPIMQVLKRPNPYQSGASFRFEQALQLSLTGTCLIWNVQNAFGKVTRRYIIPTASAEPHHPNDEYPNGYWRVNPESGRWGASNSWYWLYGSLSSMDFCIDAQDMQPVRWPHPLHKDDGYSAISAIASWSDQLDQIEKSRCNNFRNGYRPSAIITIDEFNGDQEELDRVKAQLNTEYSSVDNNGRIHVVAGGGAAVNILDKDVHEMDYTQSSNELRDSTLAAHGVPAAAVGLSSASGREGVYAPLLQFSKNMEPLLHLMAEEDNEYWVWQYGKGMYIEYLPRRVDDPEQERADLQMLVEAGAITKGELRDRLGLEKFNDERDQELAGAAGGQVDPMQAMMQQMQGGQQQGEKQGNQKESKPNPFDTAAEASDSVPKPPKPPTGKNSRGIGPAPPRPSGRPQAKSQDLANLLPDAPIEARDQIAAMQQDGHVVAQEAGVNGPVHVLKADGDSFHKYGVGEGWDGDLKETIFVDPRVADELKSWQQEGRKGAKPVLVEVSGDLHKAVEDDNGELAIETSPLVLTDPKKGCCPVGLYWSDDRDAIDFIPGSIVTSVSAPIELTEEEKSAMSVGVGSDGGYLVKHMGPNEHPSGSSQQAHSGGGSAGESGQRRGNKNDVEQGGGGEVNRPEMTVIGGNVTNGPSEFVNAIKAELVEPVENPLQVDPFFDKDGDGLTEASRVGVPQSSDLNTIPRLPRLTPDERRVESDFAQQYESNPEAMADDYARRVETMAPVEGEPLNNKTFNADDAKMLNNDYAASLENKAKYNLAVHQTGHAIAKRSFLKHLDKIALDPAAAKAVLVTQGGVAAGKGFSLKNSESMKALNSQIGAVWDSAGEQNGTDMEWIQKALDDRGLTGIYAFVHIDPTTHKYAGINGVIGRAQKKGRMVDARLFAESYHVGSQNFKAAKKAYGDRAKFLILDSSGASPRIVNTMPTLPSVEDIRKAKKRRILQSDLPDWIKRGALIGERVWSNK